MSGGEAAALAFGVVAMVASVGFAYRYTISPRAPERMAEANRKYVPSVEKAMTPRQAVVLYGSLLVLELGAAIVFGSATLAFYAVVSAAAHAYAIYRAFDRDSARGGARTPTSEDTAT